MCLVQTHAGLKRQARNLCYLSTVLLQDCAPWDETAAVLWRLHLCWIQFCPLRRVYRMNEGDKFHRPGKIFLRLSAFLWSQWYENHTNLSCDNPIYLVPMPEVHMCLDNYRIHRTLEHSVSWIGTCWKCAELELAENQSLIYQEILLIPAICGVSRIVIKFHVLSDQKRWW